MSRTGRLASLEVEDDPPQEILAPGAFTQLSLPLNLYLGGAPSTDMYSPKMKTTASFVGCIQTVILNRREVRNFARMRPRKGPIYKKEEINCDLENFTFTENLSNCLKI